MCVKCNVSLYVLTNAGHRKRINLPVITYFTDVVTRFIVNDHSLAKKKKKTGDVPWNWSNNKSSQISRTHLLLSITVKSCFVFLQQPFIIRFLFFLFFFYQNLSINVITLIQYSLGVFRYELFSVIAHWQQPVVLPWV